MGKPTLLKKVGTLLSILAKSLKHVLFGTAALVALQTSSHAANYTTSQECNIGQTCIFTGDTFNPVSGRAISVIGGNLQLTDSQVFAASNADALYLDSTSVSTITDSIINGNTTIAGRNTIRLIRSSLLTLEGSNNVTSGYRGLNTQDTSRIVSNGNLNISINDPLSVNSQNVGIVTFSNSFIALNGDQTIIDFASSQRIAPVFIIGVVTYNNSAVELNSAETIINIAGHKSSASVYGLSAQTGSLITTKNAQSLVSITSKGEGSEVGITADGTNSRINLANVNVKTLGTSNGFSSVRATTKGEVTFSGLLDIESPFSLGVEASDAGTVTLNNVNVKTGGNASHSIYSTGALSKVAINGKANLTTAGENSFGLAVYDAASILVENANLDINTVGSESHAILASGSSSVLALNGGFVKTSGTNAHGISLQNGALKTFDSLQNNILPTLMVSGAGSALLHTSAAQLILNNQVLNISSTPNALNNWGVKAENSGEIIFNGGSTGGTGLWARDAGAVTLSSTTDGSGSHVFLDDEINSAALIIGQTATIGSLQGGAASSVIAGQNNTFTIGQNNATNNGSLIDNTNFAGEFDGVNQLIKTGALTQILSGVGNTVGSVEVNSGTLKFSQNDPNTKATPFTVTGNYTTKAGATTAVGDANSTLVIGSNYMQEAGSTLDIILGASPDIQAKTAQLAGRLVFSGFTATTDPTKASAIIDSTEYEMIRTTDGIIGSYAEVDDVDYVISNGFVSPDDKSYMLGFALSWTQGGSADGTGNFTMVKNTALDVDVALNNQTPISWTFASGWNGRDLTKNGEGELVLSAVNGYTGSTTVNGGALYLAGAGDIYASSNVALAGEESRLSLTFLGAERTKIKNLSGVAGSSVNLSSKQLNIENTQDTVFAGDFDDNAGSLVKEGAKSLTLSGKTLYTGNTLINQGELVLDGINGGAQLTSNVIGKTGTTLSLKNGAVLTGSIDPTDVNIDGQSTWNMTDNSLVNHLNLNGNLNFSAPSSNDFKTLTVEGNFAGNNGLIRMNTVLGDDASLTDKIIVQGDTSGTTKVAINNIGGAGAQTIDGIQIIEVKGQSLGEFTKVGRIVAGAYDYELDRSKIDNKNWVLNSELTPINNLGTGHILRPEAGGYLGNAIAAGNLFLDAGRVNPDGNGFGYGSNNRNDGLAGDTGRIKSISFWLNTRAGQARSLDETKQIKTDSNHQVAMLGGDASLNAGKNGVLRFGAMTGYAHSSNDSSSNITGYRAKGSVSGYSVGIYANWQQNEDTNIGTFVDGSLQYSWLKNSLKGQFIRDENYNSDGITATLEAGYTFKIAGDDSVSYFLQPKAQVAFLGIKTDDFREFNGTHIKNNDGNIVQTKLGLRGFAKIKSSNKSKYFNIFTEVNLINYSDDISIKMDNVKINSKGAKNIVEIKLGTEGQFNKSLSAWGNMSYKKGSNRFHDASLNFGVKYRF